MTFLTLYKKTNLKFIKTVLGFSKNEVLSFFYSFPLNNSPIILIVLNLLTYEQMHHKRVSFGYF